MNTYTVTIKIPDKGYVEAEFPKPDRLPQCGDVYAWTRPCITLANKAYNIGDRMTVLERTGMGPHGRVSSLGNLIIECPHFRSVWTNFDSAVAEGWLILVEAGK